MWLWLNRRGEIPIEVLAVVVEPLRFNSDGDGVAVGRMVGVLRCGVVMSLWFEMGGCVF